MHTLSNNYTNLSKGNILSKLIKPLKFLFQVYKTRKTVELSSFILWEIMHKLALFPHQKYVKIIAPNDSFKYLSKDYSIRSWEQYINYQKEPTHHQWVQLIIDKDNTYWGYLKGQENILVKSTDTDKNIHTVQQFQSAITSLFISKQQPYIFITSEGVLYRSSIHNVFFQKCLELTTPQSYFLFNNGMTELPDGSFALGEYASIWEKGNWKNVTFFYYSNIGGDIWTKSDFFIKKGANKHLHIVKYSQILNTLIITDGDNKKRLWFHTFSGDKSLSINMNNWKLISKFHIQTGGYLAMTENQRSVYFGSDYLGGTNFIIVTTNGIHFDKQIIPDPFRKSPIMNMLTLNNNDIWTVLHSSFSNKKLSLLMYSHNNGESWEKIIEYDGTLHEIKLISAYNIPTNYIYISIQSYLGTPNQQYKTYKISAR